MVLRAIDGKCFLINHRMESSCKPRLHEVTKMLMCQLRRTQETNYRDREIFRLVQSHWENQRRKVEGTEKDSDDKDNSKLSENCT